MDRGGSITWYLNADDSEFNTVNRRVRAESKATAREVDRNFKDGTDKANTSLTNFRIQLARSAGFIRNFAVATRGFNLTTLILGVTVAAGAIIELAGAVAASAGVLYAVPAAIAVMVSAFTVGKIATIGLADAFDAVLKGDAEDLADAMKNLSPAAKEVVNAFSDIKNAFAPVQQAVQEAFFIGFGEQMRSLASTYMPLVQNGAVGIAKSINNMGIVAANVAKEPFFQGTVNSILSETATVTDTLSGAIRPLAIAISGVIQAGLPFVNMLANWIVQLAESAAAFTSSEDGQKKMTAAINLGIAALKKIGDLAGSVAGLLVSLFKVSQIEGLSFIDTIINVIDRMNDWVNSAKGQKQLQALFATTNEVFLEVLDVVGKVAQIVLDIVEAFDKLPSPVQNVIVGFLAWTAVLTPIVGYVAALFTSIRTVVLGIKLLAGPIKAITMGMSLLVQGFQDARVAASVFSGFMGTLGGILRTGLTVAINGAKLAFFLLRAAMLANPVGAIIAGITLLVGAFVYLYNNVEGFRNFFNGVWTSIQGVVAGVIAWFTSSVVPFFQGIWSAIISGLTAFASFWNGVWGGFLNIFQSVWSTVTTIFNTAVGIFSAIAAPFIAVFSGILYVVQAVGMIIYTVFSGIVQIITIVVTTIAQIIGVVLYGTFMFLWNNILLPTGLFFANIFTTIVNTVVGAVTTIASVITSVFSTIYGFLVGVFTGVSNFLIGVWTAIYGAILSTVSGIVSGVVGLFSGLASTVSGIFSGISSFLSGIWNTISSVVINAVSGMVSAVVGKFNEIKNAVSNAMSGAVSTVSGFVGQFLSAGKNVIDGLVRGISNGKDAVVGKIKEIASGALDAIKSFFGIKSPSRVMAQMGDYLMQGLNKGIIKTGQEVISSTQGIANGIASSFGTLDGGKYSASIDADVSGLDGASKVIGGNYGGGSSSRIENHIGQITIANDVDAEDWLQKLTRQDEITETGLTSNV